MYFFTLDEVIDACMEYIRAEFLPDMVALVILGIGLTIFSVYILYKLNNREDKKDGK